MAGRMSAASAPITLADKSQWQISPLTDRDYDELTEWARCYILELAKQSIRQFDYTEHEAERLTRVALEKSVEVSWCSYEGKKLFMTPIGVARLFWQSVQKKHPRTVAENLRAHFYVSENVSDFMDLFFTINARGPGGVENPSEAAEAPQTTQ